MKKTIRRESYVLHYDTKAHELIMRSAQGRLRLACQGAVSKPGFSDAGTEWTFQGEEERNGRLCWRFDAKRTIWQRKSLLVEIADREVLFRLEVEGQGPIDRAVFFAGFPSESSAETKSTLGVLRWSKPAWNRSWQGSPCSFDTVINPQPVVPGPQRLPAGISQRITSAATFGPELFNPFFAPPLLAYGFDEAFTAGVAAPIRECRFTHFDYVATTGWGLELHFEGKTMVDGRWLSPAIRVAPCADVESGWADYANALRESGMAPALSRTIPDWARRPMFCGWGQQTVWANEAQNGNIPAVGTPLTPGACGYANQNAYEEMVRLLDERDLPYGTFTIDMGWSPCLTIPTLDEKAWPDLKGFIERLHGKGKRVFLWLATWNPGGLEDGLRMPHAAGLPDSADPTNPVFRERLARAIEQAVSPNGLNADGFKIDFTGDLPRGNYQPAGDLWGMAMTHDYLTLIHGAMKAAKSDSVLETHCANPQFADVTEMIRLNDLFNAREDVRPAMEFRARLAKIALPGYPIDTDNDPFISRAAWLDYLRAQPKLGLPSLYTLTHMSFTEPDQPAEPILSENWDEIRRIWLAYNNGKFSGIEGTEGKKE